MKKVITIGIMCLPFVLTLFWACKPLEVYPTTPEISFKSLAISEGYDTVIGDSVSLKTYVVLTFHLIDGDGDVGLLRDDTINFPDPNLYVSILEKTDTGFVDINSEYPWTFRTPYVETVGQDKSLVADFEVTFNFIKGTLPDGSIIKMRYYIFDRQLNKSNEDETPEFPSDTTGTIKPLEATVKK
jgi:hypothetical protein